MAETPQDNNQGRVLVFDSGVGGLSVVGEIRKRSPHLRLDYVADDAFRPYGEKTADELIARLPALLATLDVMLQPDAIVIACNTASVTALATIRGAVDTPVIGVVPAIKPASARSKTRTIGVLGTPGTVRRKYVDGLIEKFAGDCDVVLQGSVNLVEWAERKLEGAPLPIEYFQRELSSLFEGRRGANIDVVVLACTHFPLLTDELKTAARQSVQWVDSGAAIAKRVEVVLERATLKPREKREDIAFLIGPNAASGRVKAFESFGFDRVIGLMPG